MKISKMANLIEPSLGRKLFNMAQQYNDVIDLTLGDPDLKPNQIIRQAACCAITEGRTRYSANRGLAELRKSIAHNFEKEYNLVIDPDSEIIITVGGMEALFLSIACLIDEGEEVLIQAPYYVNYVQMVRMCGGVPKIIYTKEENNFTLSIDELEQAVTPRTVAMIINSPCNPTGQVLSAEQLDRLADFAKKYDLTVISDEVYRSLIFEESVFDSIITRKGMRERTVVIDSLSKRFSMTGYRVGYAIAPSELVDNMSKMQENVAACAPLPSQYAAIAAFSNCSDDRANVIEFKKRRDYVFEQINKIQGLSCKEPQATFYAFVNISKTGLSCLDFSYKLLQNEHVAVVPGITYGKEYSDYIRIAFTLDIDRLKEAMGRIGLFIKGLNING